MASAATMNPASINSSPAISNFQQTTTTTTTQYPANGTGMGNQGNQAPMYAVYDKPADRRLRPWILLGSVILGLLAAAMIIFTFVKSGTIHSLWGLFIAGCILGGAAILGFLTGWTLRPALKALFFWVLLFCWIAAVAVLIVNAALLNHYMNNQCGGNAHSSFTCQHIREYHFIVYTAFGVPVALWVPTLIIAAGYLWRTAHLMRKGAAPAAPVVPVGTSNM